MISDNDGVDQFANPIAGESGPRVRVRTPGKHIVLFALAVTFMLALSTTVLRSGGAPLMPSHQGAAKDFRTPALEFLTDLSPDAAGRIAFLRLKASIVARDKEALAEIEANAPEIRERISFFLRELSPEDFAGTGAMTRLKAELLKRARISVGAGAVTDVIVEDLVIQ